MTLIDALPARCFDLARDVDVHVASTGRSGERAIGAVTSGLLELDDEVTFRARHLGLMWTLTSRITEFERPDRFVDVMQRGAFRSWHHEHRFRAVDTGTEMVDVVDYVAPGGPIGTVVNHLVLQAYMTELLVERGRHIKAVAEAG